MGRLLETARAAILQSELSQRELARRVNVDPSQINRFTRGERTVSAETLDELLEALGLDVVPKGRAKGTAKQR